MEELKTVTLGNLFEQGIIKIAEKPVGNPKEIPQKGPYAVFLMEEDYPGLTSAMWNKVAERFGLNFQIIMLVAKPSGLPKILSAVKGDKRVKGGVFGVGFKDESIRFLDEKEPIVAISDSANVFVKTPEAKIAGFNTDAAGFMRSLNQKLHELNRGGFENKRIVVFGAGGTGAAITFLLAQAVQDIVLINRTVDKAVKVSSQVNGYYKKDIVRFAGEDEIANEVVKADVIVNTTTKGASGPFSAYTALTPAGAKWTPEKNLQESEKLLSSLSNKPLVCDVVLVGGDTPTIALAKRLGLPTLDGRLMNLYQAIPAIKLVFPQVAKISDSELEKTMHQAQIEATQ